MLARLFVILLIEATDQLLEHCAHRVVVKGRLIADLARAEVYVLVELLDELTKGVAGLGEAR